MTQTSDDRATTAGRRPSLPVDLRGLERGLQAAVGGEVRFDAASRAMYANDGSNFRQVPIGVVIPRTLEDIVAAHRVCAGFGAPVVNRGGGTSLSGETVNYAWDRALSADRPTLLDVRTDPNVPPIPPHATFEQAKDSAEAMLKGDEDRRGVIVEGVKTKVQEFLPHRDSRGTEGATDE